MAEVYITKIDEGCNPKNEGLPWFIQTKALAAGFILKDALRTKEKKVVDTENLYVGYKRDSTMQYPDAHQNCGQHVFCSNHRE